MRDSYDVVFLPLGSAGYGGAERSLLDLAGRLRALGARVLVLAERALEPGVFGDEARARGLELRWVEWAPEHSAVHNLREGLRVFGRLRARVIHFNISWRRGMWALPLAARLAGSARLIGTMRAIPDPSDRIARKRYLFGLVPGLQLWRLPDVLGGRMWARCLHYAVSVNRDNYPPRMVKEYGFDPARLGVIYNGIALPVPATAAERARQRAALGLHADQFAVCYFGRLSPEKGVHHLLAAVRALPARVHVIVVGEGPQSVELQELAAQPGLAGRVRFEGFLAQPLPVVSACDAVAVPSTWEEAFGRTVVEALACERPVVATRVGGMAELFEHGVHGLYVEAGDVRGLAAALAELAADPARAAAMGAEGRAWVQERYALERVTEEYASAYARLLGEPLLARAAAAPMERT